MKNTTIRKVININRLTNNILSRFYNTDKVDVSQIQRLVLQLDRLAKELSGYLPKEVEVLLNDYRNNTNFDYDKEYWSNLISDLFIKGDIKNAKSINTICNEIEKLKRKHAIEIRVKKLKRLELNIKIGELGFVF